MIVGIDLGTTNSLIGSFTQDGPRLFTNPLGDVLTPSAISMDDDGAIIVGQGARDRLVTHPARSVATFKRWMGSARETLIGDKAFRPEELSALVLRSLINDAEAASGETVTEAVISVPAYFSDAQRKATRTAGELAGIKVDRLINEPTAAALSYGLQERRDGGRFLVCDLGGGTFDVSIMELFDDVFEVHASAGDNFLGGEDFLELLVDGFARDNGIELGSLPREQLALLRRRAEILKRSLSHAAKGKLEIEIGGKLLSWSIDEERFAELAAGLIQRLRTPIERAMRDANLQPAQLDEIVLVGGASRMPIVARTLSRLFGRLPLRTINPDQAIGLGACVAAGLKARNSLVKEIILTDVCPHSLGSSCARFDAAGKMHAGFFMPIIHRNSTVPVSREEMIHPVHRDQQLLLIEVYQGESPMVSKNIKLGELTVDIKGSLGKQDRSVKLRYTYDINGLLLVEATVLATQQHFDLVIEQNPGLLSPDEVKRRLRALQAIKVHPREQQENLALIARAERFYEEHLQHREMLQQMIVAFQQQLEAQDLRQISNLRRDLSRALTELEGNS
jgi:molecular chaperone HscC